MQPDEDPAADVEIVASAAADKLRCHVQPKVWPASPEQEPATPVKALPEKDIPADLPDAADQQPAAGRTRLAEGRFPRGDTPGSMTTTPRVRLCLGETTSTSMSWSDVSCGPARAAAWDQRAWQIHPRCRSPTHDDPVTNERPHVPTPPLDSRARRGNAPVPSGTRG
jgi:hypothetical protein